MSNTQKADRIIEMNQATRLLRRNGYSFNDNGDHVVVDDPVHQVVGREVRIVDHKPVILNDLPATIRFIEARV